MTIENTRIFKTNPPRFEDRSSKNRKEKWLWESVAAQRERPRRGPGILAGRANIDPGTKFHVGGSFQSRLNQSGVCWVEEAR